MARVEHLYLNKEAAYKNTQANSKSHLPLEMKFYWNIPTFICLHIIYSYTHGITAELNRGYLDGNVEIIFDLVRYWNSSWTLL